MEIKREKDQITYNTGDSAGAIGIIGGCIGVSNVHTTDELVFDSWAKYCANIVKPNPHTFAEMERYLLEHYDAIPLDLTERRMLDFKANVVMNHFSDQLEHKPSEFAFEMTDAEIEQWVYESQVQRQEARDASADLIGLKLHGYKLELSERNKKLFDDASVKRKTRKSKNKQPANNIHKCHVFWDEKTSHVTAEGLGGSVLTEELCLYLGISQEDIDSLSPRYIGYIRTLTDNGELISLAEYETKFMSSK